MNGIQFITDEKGRRKTSVVIDLKKHKALWEDFLDGLISESQRKEKALAFEKVKADLIERGRLRARGTQAVATNSSNESRRALESLDGANSRPTLV